MSSIGPFAPVPEPPKPVPSGGGRGESETRPMISAGSTAVLAVEGDGR